MLILVLVSQLYPYVKVESKGRVEIGHAYVPFDYLRFYVDTFRLLHSSIVYSPKAENPSIEFLFQSPDTAVSETTKVDTVVVKMPLRLIVNFFFSSGEVLPEQKDIMLESIDFSVYDTAIVSIYTDSVGTLKQNWIVVERRKAFIEGYLKAKGFKGHIEFHLNPKCCYIADNRDPEGRLRNRRAIIELR